ncbi:glycosyltransferase [Clostridioides difficile]
MNNEKICFITCVNNERLYEECLLYINNLDVPPNFSIEIIALRGECSIASAYNKAIRETDSKYKVYLHQDTFIINKNFIYDILHIFKNNIDTGMIGVAGAKDIPISGIWWDSHNKVGKVYDSHTSKMALYEFSNIEELTNEVMVVDGLIMITQYDLFWREDKFDGWHFYDLSQSMEFKKNNYKVVVPKQDKPWCMHDSGVANTSNGFEKYRLKYIEEYEEEIYSNLPLVSILIPTYNETNFFPQALESALNQTYKKIEIVIGDDSTNKDVKILVEKYMSKYKNIRYIDNNGPLGEKGKRNMENLFKKAKGDYVNYLMHDDLYIEDKIEKMMNYFQNDKSLALVTSSRYLIDEENNILDTLSIAVDTNVKFEDREAIELILLNLKNFIGEPTTAIFKKNIIDKELIDLDGNQLTCLADVGIWIKILSKGNMVYIKEPLSAFRYHENQNTYNQIIQSGSAVDWYYVIKYCYENKILNKESKYFDNIISLWFDKYIDLMNAIYEYKPLRNEIDEYERVKGDIDNLLKNYMLN